MITSLDRANRKKLEKYVKDNFIPQNTENLSGGFWNSFKCGDITLSNEYTYIDLKIGSNEVFSISTMQSSIFKSLYVAAQTYHSKQWTANKNKRAAEIIKNLT